MRWMVPIGGSGQSVVGFGVIRFPEMILAEPLCSLIAGSDAAARVGSESPDSDEEEEYTPEDGSFIVHTGALTTKAVATIMGTLARIA